MSDPVMDELQRRFKPIMQKLEYLHDRWQDEKEYENWTDYVDVMRKLTPPETEFVKATKRPFGFEVKTKSGGGFSFFASARQAGFNILNAPKERAH